MPSDSAKRLQSKTTCAHCGRPLVRVLFVCTACWVKVPAKDRQMMVAMVNRNQDTSSKEARILRLLREHNASHA